MKVALVHDWLTGMRGGERCLEVFCELFPDAPIYTLVYVQGSASPVIANHEIIPSYLNRVPWVKSRYRYFLPLFPSAIRSFDIGEMDLVLSSSHCVAKGIPVPQGVCHLSYIHTPMRYVWDSYDEYFGDKAHFSLGKIGMGMFRKRLQDWDVTSSRGVHAFLANSWNVAEKVFRLYGRNAAVIHPPVDWKAFRAVHEDEGFYLMVTALAPYKKVELAICAANKMKLPLTIVGRGPEERRLRGMAGPSVRFLGWLSDKKVRELYGNCRAILFPGEEDFGIVPLEAMASGKAVIAFGKGGVLESVIPLNPPPHSKFNPGSLLQEDPKEGGAGSFSPEVFLPPTKNQAISGVFFYEQSVESLIEAIRLFEERSTSFNPEEIRKGVEKFDRSRFQVNVKQTIEKLYREYQEGKLC